MKWHPRSPAENATYIDYRPDNHSSLTCTRAMKTILIVDDNEMFRLTLADWLRLEGFQPLAAENGFDGLRLAQQYQPDLILCDINMPMMNGFEVLRKIRLQDDTVDIPFFFLTSEPATTSFQQAQSLGADGFVSKSDGIDALHRVLRRLEPAPPTGTQ